MPRTTSGKPTIEAKNEMSRRNEMEIIADILTEALQPRNRTRIMYRTNLSFFQANRYFTELLEKGLLMKENDGNGGIVHYKTTEKGEHLLKILNRAQTFLATDEAAFLVRR